MADNKNPYAGKIKNTGAQVVQAPYAEKGKKGETKIIKGNDLRSGKK